MLAGVQKKKAVPGVMEGTAFFSGDGSGRKSICSFVHLIDEPRKSARVFSKIEVGRSKAGTKNMRHTAAISRAVKGDCPGRSGFKVDAMQKGFVSLLADWEEVMLACKAGHLIGFA